MTKDDALRMALKILMEQEVEQDEDCGHPDCQECQYGNELRKTIAAINEALKEKKTVSTIKVNQEMYARVFKMLIEDPCTTHDIVEETGMHLVTAQSLMRCFNKHKIVHIKFWEKDAMGRDRTQVYAFGKGKDKPRARMSDAERKARSRSKQNMLKLTNVLHGTMTEAL